MSTRKLWISFWTLTAILIAGPFYGLYQFTGHYGKSHHGWEIWPVNSHHIILPILMLIFYITLGILIFISWLDIGDKLDIWTI